MELCFGDLQLNTGPSGKNLNGSIMFVAPFKSGFVVGIFDIILYSGRVAHLFFGHLRGFEDHYIINIIMEAYGNSRLKVLQLRTFSKTLSSFPLDSDHLFIKSFQSVPDYFHIEILSKHRLH